MILSWIHLFFSGNFLLQRAKKPLSFHLCFFPSWYRMEGGGECKAITFLWIYTSHHKWSKSWVLCFQPNSSNALKRYMFMSGDDDATPTSDNITTLNSACGAELVKFCCKIVGWQDQHWTVTDSWCWWGGNIAATAEKDGPVVLVQYGPCGACANIRWQEDSGWRVPWGGESPPATEKFSFPPSTDI